MKFVSKQINLMLTLKPALQREPLTGRPADPGIHVRFAHGLFSTDNDDLITALKNHPSFGYDFVQADSMSEEDMKRNLDRVEPAHVITELKYGTPESTVGEKRPLKLTPEMEKYVSMLAEKRALDILKQIAENQTDTVQAEQLQDEPSVEINPLPTPDNIPNDVLGESSVNTDAEKTKKGRPKKKV